MMVKEIHVLAIETLIARLMSQLSVDVVVVSILENYA